MPLVPAARKPNAGTLRERLHRIQSYEVLILFVLVVLLSLVLVVSQGIVSVDDPAGPRGRPLPSARPVRPAK